MPIQRTASNAYELIKSRDCWHCITRFVRVSRFDIGATSTLTGTGWKTSSTHLSRGTGREPRLRIVTSLEES